MGPNFEGSKAANPGSKTDKRVNNLPRNLRISGVQISQPETSCHDWVFVVFLSLSIHMPQQHKELCHDPFQRDPFTFISCLVYQYKITTHVQLEWIWKQLARS
jgi:hypothetical protein